MNTTFLVLFSVLLFASLAMAFIIDAYQGHWKKKFAVEDQNSHQEKIKSINSGPVTTSRNKAA